MNKYEKLVPIENTMYYSFDKVSCFEQPIGNLLNFENGYYGHAFIMLSKIYQFYFLNPNTPLREKTVEVMMSTLNAEIKEASSSSEMLKMLEKEIDHNHPLIVGINCNDLFYSDHYMIEDWPHWMLITGYNSKSKTIQIIDDLHLLYCNRENEYAHFYLTKQILKQINKAYLSTYGKKWSCFSFYLKDVLPLTDVLITVLDYYMNFDFESGTYSEIALFREYNKCSEKEIKDLIKKKIVNTVKYRGVFTSVIKRYMAELSFDSDMINNMVKYDRELEILWNNYVYANLLSCDNENRVLDLPESIIKQERKISQIVSVFRDHLRNVKLSDKTAKLHKTALSPRIDNDIDNIVSIDENRISFNFNTDKLYNWWYDDEAPKIVLMSNINPNKHFCAHTKIIVEQNFLENSFQAGIFLRTKEETLFAAIDVNNAFVLDKVGFINKSKSFTYENEVEIDIEVKHKKVVAKISSSKNQAEIEWNLSTDSEIEIGLASKTWGNGNRLNINFTDYYVKTEQ